MGQGQETRIVLWRHILRELLEELGDNGHRTGDAFYSLNDLCEKYHVSQITAKKVFSELEHRGRIRTVPRRGSFILKNSSPIEVHFILPEGRNIPNASYFDFEVFLGISETAQETGAALSIHSGFASLASLPPGKRNFIVLEVAGLDVDLKKLPAHTRDSIMLITHAYQQRSGFPSVGSDYGKGAWLATKHLLSLGHTRIGLISNMISNPWHIPRFQGYEKALRSRGIKTDLRLIKETDQERPEETFWAMEEPFALKKPPTAIFATNDKRALQVMEFCGKKGIRVPEDLSVIGFDNLPESALSDPPLTTVDTHLREIGRRSVFHLIEIRNETAASPNVLIESDLVLRNSTGKV